MAFKHISSSEEIRNNERKHTRTFSDSFGLYQEDNYGKKFFRGNEEEEYKNKMIKDGYVLRFEHIDLKNLSTRIQWIKYATSENMKHVKTFDDFLFESLDTKTITVGKQLLSKVKSIFEDDEEDNKKKGEYYFHSEKTDEDNHETSTDKAEKIRVGKRLKTTGFGNNYWLWSIMLDPDAATFVINHGLIGSSADSAEGERKKLGKIEEWLDEQGFVTNFEEVKKLL